MTEIVNTKRFNLDEAKLGSGWLQDLHAMTAREMNGRKVITPKPETEEYSVRNFVYRKHRPFHPERLFRMVRDVFILQLQHDGEEDEEDEEEDESEDESEQDHTPKDAKTKAKSEELEDSVMVESDGTSSDNEPPHSPSTPATSPGKDDLDDLDDVPDNDTILKNKRAHPVLANLLRSKGGFWLATRPNQRGEWSQAGAMLTLVGDMPFFCTMDSAEYEGEDGEVNKLVQHDIDAGGEWGDRRQELVFIGVDLQREKLAEMLDSCLLDDTEWEDWQRVMRDDKRPLEDRIDELNNMYADGFPDWPEDDEHDHEHDHEGNLVEEVS